MWERVGTKSFTGFLLLFLAFTLVFSFGVQLVKSEVASEGEGTVVRVIPGIIEFEGVDVVGETFSVAVAVENVGNLSGLYIVLRWNLRYLHYVCYTNTIPVECYPTPQSPSPYPGIIHSPILSFPMGPYELDGWGEYPASSATLGGPSFNGSGTVFVMTFRVTEQPQPFEEDAVLTLRFIASDLARSLEAGGDSIPHALINGTVIIHAFPTHELSVVSMPFTSIPFTIDEVDERTPYRTALPQDSYVLKVPATHNQLVWSHWLEDGDTNRTKTILLDTDITLTAVYARPIGGFSTLIESGYFSSWILLTLLTVLFFASSIHFKRKHAT